MWGKQNIVKWSQIVRQLLLLLLLLSPLPLFLSSLIYSIASRNLVKNGYEGASLQYFRLQQKEKEHPYWKNSYYEKEHPYWKNPCYEKEHPYWKLRVVGRVVVVGIKLETNQKYNSYKRFIHDQNKSYSRVLDLGGST